MRQLIWRTESPCWNGRMSAISIPSPRSLLWWLPTMRLNRSACSEASRRSSGNPTRTTSGSSVVIWPPNIPKRSTWRTVMAPSRATPHSSALNTKDNVACSPARMWVTERSAAELDRRSLASISISSRSMPVSLAAVTLTETSSPSTTRRGSASILTRPSAGRHEATASTQAIRNGAPNAMTSARPEAAAAISDDIANSAQMSKSRVR